MARRNIMTTFEEMEAAWKAQSAKLDQVTLLLADQVRRENVAQVKTPLHRLTFSLWFEIALSAAGMLLMGSFLAEHITQARFVWPAALMDVWFGATLIAAVRQLLTASKINYDGPIAGVQEQLGRLRILRLKTFRWLFLTGQIVWWMPFLITSLQMVFGVDAYRYLSIHRGEHACRRGVDSPAAPGAQEIPLRREGIVVRTPRRRNRWTKPGRGPTSRQHRR
jgi:hypothetical protein